MEEYAINQSIEDTGKLVALRRRRRTLHRSLAESLPKRSSQHSSGDMGVQSQSSIVGRNIYIMFSRRCFQENWLLECCKSNTCVYVTFTIYLIGVVVANALVCLSLRKIDLEHA